MPARLSFEEARRIFLKQNPDLQAARARADEQSHEAWAPALWPNPSLSLQRNQVNAPGGGIGSENTVALVQPLRYPGEHLARRSASRSATAQAGALYEEEAAELYQELRVRYAAAIAARERLAVHEVVTKAVREAAKIGDVRLQEGDISPFERSRLRVALATYEDELEAAQRDHRDTRIELAYFLSPASHAGHHAAEERLLTLTGSLIYESLDLDYEALVEAALARRGLMKSSQASIRAREEGLRVERYARLPELALTAGYRGETQPGVLSSGFTLGLQVGLPVFHQRQPQVRAARAGARAARYEAKEAKREVELSVHEAYESLMSYQSRIEHISGTILSGSDRLLKDALYIYEEGEIELVGLLDAVEATKTARLLQINLVTEHTLARYALARALGVGPSEPSPLD